MPPLSAVKRSKSTVAMPMRTGPAPPRRAAAMSPARLQHVVDAQQQFAEGEGLGHVVVGAQFEAADAILR